MKPRKQKKNPTVPFIVGGGRNMKVKQDNNNEQSNYGTHNQVSISGGNFEGCQFFPVSQDAHKKLSKISIDNVGQPSQKFIPSTIYSDTKEYVANEFVSILHLHGMPGSGKSEIVRNLAAEFSNQGHDLVAKWHIECSDQSHDIKDQLEKFANGLLKNHIIHDSGLEIAIDNMKSGRSKDFVSILSRAQIPMLLIIEDPPVDDKILLNDFIKCINNIKPNKKFHVYITSKSKSVLNCGRIARYESKQIDGLTLEEGLQLLEITEAISVEERQAAEEIVKRLSNSPLGLRVVVAKRKDFTTFNEYLQYLSDDKISQQLYQQELKEAKSLNQKHLYEAIILLLRPDSSDEDKVRNWKAIAALSLSHHGAISTVLVKKIMQAIREGENNSDVISFRNETETAMFVRTFEDFGMCKTVKLRETITFHEAVFIAVQLYLKQNSPIHRSYLQLYGNNTFHHLYELDSNYPGQFNQIYIYKAIILLLAPESTDKDVVRNWNVISALSLCHHEAIPTILVRRIMQIIRQAENDFNTIKHLNKVETDNFVQTVKGNGLCTVEFDNFSKETITFYEAVFVAVRLYLKETNQLHKYFAVSVQALASIVHKDIRKSINAVFIKEMVPHMHALVTHYKLLVEKNMVKADDFLLHFCTSHLHEVIGVIASTRYYLSVAERNLEQCMHILSQITAILGFRVDVPSLLIAEPLPDGKQCAKEIVKKCFDCGKFLLQKSNESFKLEEFLSIILRFSEDDFSYLSQFCDTEVMEFINKATELDLKVPPGKLTEIQQKNMEILLSKENLYKTYLVERFASVFQTISHLILYSQNEISSEKRQKSIWFSTLAYELCAFCFSETGVASLFLQLTACSNVNIRLRVVYDDPNIIETLTHVKSFVMDNLVNKRHEGVKYYEHGLIRQVEGLTYTDMANTNFLIRINNKLIANRATDGLAESTELCEMLQNKALENLDWAISLKCLVRCSKFWSLNGQHSKAVETILKALQNPGILKVSELSYTYPWACKNYAKIVICGKLRDHKELVIEKCNDALKDENQISKQLVKGIKNILAEINEM